MSIFAVMFHHFHDGKKHIKGQGSIDSETFRTLLLYLRTKYRILPPEGFAEKVLQGTLTTDDICLTFDDALKCQVDIALPVLQELNLNAFFFVYSGALYGPPDHLEVFRDFRHRKFSDMDSFYKVFFASVAQNYPEKFMQYKQDYPEEYLKEFSFYSEQDRRFRFIRDNTLINEEYEAIMFSIMNEFDYSMAKFGPRLVMDEADLHTLYNKGNVIGLHSTSHPTTIDTYSYADQWREYHQNKSCLEESIGTKIWAMSHPCGKYNDSTLTILHDLEIKIGFRSSLAIREIRSSLEIPREDHAILVRALQS